MSKIKLNADVPELIQEFYSFVLKENVSLNNIDSKVKLFDSKFPDIKKRKSFIVALENFSFFDTNHYNSDLSEELYYIVLLLSNFKGEVLHKLKNLKTIDFEKIGKLERQISPPIEVYEPSGMHEADIKFSKRSHGLLFD